MSRRVYVKGKKTYAKGQAPDLSKSNRYQNIISLMSIRVEDVHEVVTVFVDNTDIGAIFERVTKSANGDAPVLAGDTGCICHADELVRRP